MLTERLTVERTPQGIRLSGIATFGPLVASIVLRGELVPPGGTDSEWRAMLAFTLDAVAVIS
jgi:hypothetical protein